MAANTLTGLIPIFYQAMENVNRELVNVVGKVATDARAEQVGKDQTIRIPVAGTSSLTSVSPAMTVPDSGETTDTYTDITMDKMYMYPMKFYGEEEKALGSANFQDLVRQKTEQGIRAFANQISTDLLALYPYASRAYGTGGTTPFASDLSALANIKKILDDNGCPDDGLRSLIINTDAGVALRNLGIVSANYMAGSSDTLRSGRLLDLYGFMVAEDAHVAAHTKGAGTSYDFVSAGEDIGQTTLSFEGGTVNTTGIKAGDVMVFGSDTNKYVVNTGSTGTSGTIVIGKPGLKVAGVDAGEWVIQNSYTANLAFHKNAIQLAARLPASSSFGSLATDQVTVTDPITGLTFAFTQYGGYHMGKVEISLLWGVKAIKQENIAILLG